MISDHCDAVAPFNGYVAYQKLKLHCHREPNDVTVMALIKQFNDAKFSDVGRSAETISDYVVYLATINADLPVGSKRTESEIAVKLLSGFDPKSNLGMIAMTEHSAPEAERRFWRPAVAAAAGVPAQPASRDLQRIQCHFDPLWRTIYEATQDGTRGHQADGAMHVGGDGDEDGDEDAFFTAGAGRGRALRAQARGDRPVRGDSRLAGGTLTLKQCQLARLPRCYACQGHGHVSRDCANPPDVKISVETNISLLGECQRARAPGRPGPRPPSSSQASSSSSRPDHSRPRDARPARGAPPDGQAQRGQRDRGRGRAYYAEGEHDEEEDEDEYSDDGSGVDDSYFTYNSSPPTCAPPALARDIAERLAFIDDTGAFGGFGFDEAYACDVCEPAAPQPVVRELLNAAAPQPARREPLGRRFQRRRDGDAPPPAVVPVGGETCMPDVVDVWHCDNGRDFTDCAASDSLELCDDCFVTWPDQKGALERAWVVDCGCTKHIVPAPRAVNSSRRPVNVKTIKNAMLVPFAPM